MQNINHLNTEEVKFHVLVKFSIVYKWPDLNLGHILRLTFSTKSKDPEQTNKHITINMVE